MLKRNQVLLFDWQDEYIRFLTKRHDLSFSEVIRLEISLATIATVSKLYPNFKANLTISEIGNAFKGATKKHVEEMEVRNLVSKIYFEARKAAEFRMNAEQHKKQ